MKEQANCFDSYKFYCVMDNQICHMAVIENKAEFVEYKGF